MEALELHYRINASILKYLELHEGKEISNTLGEFFKKCLDSSKFLKKQAPKETPEPVIKDVAETPAKTAETLAKTAETLAKTAEPVASTGFQEQFLNSLNKLNAGKVDLPVEEDVDDDKSENKKEDSPEKEEKGDKEEKIEKDCPSVDKEIQKTDSNSQDVKIIEDPASLNVITISDSEEEKDKRGKFIIK